MATVPLPDITYRPSLPESVIKEGKLSAVQLEAISIAGQQNDIVLPGGHRASALIGDGTGVGKGRIAAGILWDNHRKGRKRLVWVSENWNLMNDAKRDLSGIGATELSKTIKAFQKFDVKNPIEHEGILFTTYALLRSQDAKGNTRIAQLQKWMRGSDEGDGSYILFDESHNLKNAVAGMSGQESQVGKTVKEYLDKNPKIRTVSLSATAATDVINLGYLDRLGLWGPGTAFPNGFPQFAAEIGSGGISAMEMVARELKAQGKYLSRTLSFKGVTYKDVEHKLTPEQKELYRTAVKAWRSVVVQAEDTIKNTNNGNHHAVARFMSLFYGAQLRFFNVLLTTLKIPTAVEDANEALAAGKSDVITLINTNEAAQNREKNKMATRGVDDEDEIPDYDFGPAEMLTDLVKEHYPTQQYKDDVDSNGNPIKVAVVDADGAPVHNPEAIKQRDKLLADIKRDLKLPANPLDILINSLGGPKQVAELTGRKERYDDTIGKFVKRGDPNVKREDINKAEAASFQAGKKRVAILSNAASTGISLQADLGSANQQKRHHTTLQVGWSADKAMQMLGRTHRTNQAHPPEYINIVSDLGGEKRFSSTIAKRLGSLGALTKGQKNATGGTDLMDKVNFESDQGKAAAKTFYDRMLRNTQIPGIDEKGMNILDQLAVLKEDPRTGVKTVPDKDRTNVTRLLNRLLALDPDIQNAVYNYYYDIFQATVQQAIEDGSLDTGVKTLPGDEFSIKEQRPIAKAADTGAETYYYPVEAKVRNDRLSVKDLETAMKRYDSYHPRLMRNDKGKLIMALDAPQIVHADGRVDNAVRIYSPGDANGVKMEAYRIREFEDVTEQAGKSVTEAEEEVSRAERELVRAEQYAERYQGDKWAQDGLEESKAGLEKAKTELAAAKEKANDPVTTAKKEWAEQYENVPSHSTKEHHLIGGAVLKYWNAIREASRGHLQIYTTVDAKTGQRVVGVDVPPGEINGLLARITGGKSTVDAAQLGADVLKNNLTYTLEQNIQVKRGRVSGSSVVQLIPPTQDIASDLKRLGVLYERGVVPVYYVPNVGTGIRGSQANEKVIQDVLDAYPVKQATDDDQEPEITPAPQAPKAPAPQKGNVHYPYDPGDVVTFSKIPPGSYLTAGEPYRITEVGNRSVYFENVKTGAGTFENYGNLNLAKYEKQEPKAGGDRFGSQRGAVSLGALVSPITAPIELAKKLGAAYDRIADAALQKSHLGRQLPEVEKEDPEIANRFREYRAAPQYYRSKAEKIVEKIVGNLDREQEKGFVLLADKESSDWLNENHHDEWIRYMDDPDIEEALAKYKPYERDLREAQRDLGGPVIEEDYLRRVYEKHVAGVNQGGKTESYPKFDRVVTPQMANKKGRIASPEYYYKYGLHEFAPSFASRYVATHLKLLESTIAADFMTKATKIEAGDTMPPFIDYNGSRYFSTEAIRLIKMSRSNSAEGKRLATELGVDQLPKPSELKPYSIYTPFTGSRLEFAARNMAQNAIRTGEYAESIAPEDRTDETDQTLYSLLGRNKGQGHGLLNGLQMRYLGPQPIIDAMERDGRDIIPQWVKDFGQITGPVVGAIRQQLLITGIPHIKNILRRVMQQSPGAQMDPRSWYRAWNILFDKSLKERALKGVDDPTFDALLKHAGISVEGAINYEHYLNFNFDEGNWKNLWGAKDALSEAFAEPGVKGKAIGVSKIAGEAISAIPTSKVGRWWHDKMFGPGGIDPRARLYIADLVRSQDPSITDAELSERINDQMGRYARASWTDLHRALAPFMMFPGWNYSSANWVLKHPLRTVLPAALLILLANAILRHYGKNREKDKYDYKRVHAGGRSFTDTMLRERMGLDNPFVQVPLDYTKARMQGKRSGESLGIALSGLSGDAGAILGEANPLVLTPIEVAMNKRSLFSHDEIVNKKDFRKRGAVIPRPLGGKGTEGVFRYGAGKLFPQLDSAYPDEGAGMDVPGFLGRNLGTSNFSEHRRRSSGSGVFGQRMGISDTDSPQISAPDGFELETPEVNPEDLKRKQTMVGPSPKGLIEAGNLDISNRPVVQNDDGTHSSEYSTSFADDQGHEVLVPTIVNGKFLTPDGKKPEEGSRQEKEMFQRAWKHYQETGEHLGIFDNPEDADAYAQRLHNRGSASEPAVPKRISKGDTVTLRNGTRGEVAYVHPQMNIARVRAGGRTRTVNLADLSRSNGY
jgi:hypothetical protein